LRSVVTLLRGMLLWVNALKWMVRYRLGVLRWVRCWLIITLLNMFLWNRSRLIGLIRSRVEVLGGTKQWRVLVMRRVSGWIHCD
jgi:hypothetical protein